MKASTRGRKQAGKKNKGKKLRQKKHKVGLANNVGFKNDENFKQVDENIKERFVKKIVPCTFIRREA